MIEARRGGGREAQPFEFSRYEIKVPLQRFQFFEFERYLRCSGLFLREAFPPRQVQSVYLDSTSFDDYHDNVSGISAQEDKDSLVRRQARGDGARIQGEAQ